MTLDGEFTQAKFRAWVKVGDFYYRQKKEIVEDIIWTTLKVMGLFFYGIGHGFNLN